MADEKTTPEENTDQQPAPKKGGGLMKMIVMAVVGLVLLGGGVFAGMQMSGSPAPAGDGPVSVEDEIVADASGGHGEAAEEDTGGHGGGHGSEAGGGETGEVSLTVPFLERLTANLNDPQGRWYVQMSMEIQATSAQAVAAIEDNTPAMREAVLMLLSTKTREDIATISGKDRLKRELRARFEGLLPADTIEDIYITLLLPVRQ